MEFESDHVWFLAIMLIVIVILAFFFYLLAPEERHGNCSGLITSLAEAIIVTLIISLFVVGAVLACLGSIGWAFAVLVVAFLLFVVIAALSC